MTDKLVENVIVLIDPLVIDSPLGSEIIRGLSESVKENRKRFHFRVQNLKIPGSLTWKRRISSSSSSGEDGNFVEFTHSLIFIDIADLVTLIRRNTLKNWTQALTDNFDSRRFTLMITKFHEFFKKRKNEKEKEKAALVRGGGEKRRGGSDNDDDDGEIQRIHVDMALTELSPAFDYLTFGVGDNIYRSVGETVYHYSRAVAEIEKKSGKKFHKVGFWAPEAKKDCVQVSASTGIGAKNLWVRYLMQISSTIGLEKAKALAEVYPSPEQLFRALDENNDPTIFADIRIHRRGADVLAGAASKIGLEASRKIWKMFSERNGDAFLTD